MSSVLTPRVLAILAATAAFGAGASQAATVQRYQQIVFEAAQQDNQPILVFIEAP